MWRSVRGSLQTSDVEVLLAYHLLHGTFPVASFSQVPQFLKSNMKNLTFENFAGGQAVELMQGPTGPQIVSGNQTVSTIAQAVSSLEIRYWDIT